MRRGIAIVLVACPILISTKTTLNSMGDVWDDNGMPVPVQQHD